MRGFRCMMMAMPADYFAKKSCTLSLGTISSLKIYAPVFGDLTILITLANERPPEVLNVATAFFAMIQTYLISLCTVTFLKIGLYFFNSKRPGVFFLFFTVM
jgi:hypothetical protein